MVVEPSVVVPVPPDIDVSELMPASVPISEVEASVEVPEASLVSPPAWLPSPAWLPQEAKVNEAAARARNNTFFIVLG
jgi:hypothetical protein